MVKIGAILKAFLYSTYTATTNGQSFVNLSLLLRMITFFKKINESYDGTIGVSFDDFKIKKIGVTKRKVLYEGLNTSTYSRASPHVNTSNTTLNCPISMSYYLEFHIAIKILPNVVWLFVFV